MDGGGGGACLHYGSAMEYITFEEALELSDGYKHAAHCCIYAMNPTTKVMGKYPAKAAVMMQNRFDGTFGFPGGFIDKEKDILVGLNRELVEELNLDISKHCVTQKDHLCSYLDHKLVLHFYKMSVSLDEFIEIEKRALDAKEYGHESMGLMRVPLFTMECGIRGFPLFLCNRFVGFAREELFYVLTKEGILSEEEMTSAISKWKKKQQETVFPS